MKNAYADLNADLASGTATPANGLCASFGCPLANVTLNVINSAFANTAYSTSAAAVSNVACSSAAAGSYSGMNGATVALYNQSFPLLGGAVSSAWRNFQSFSFHSYGGGGAGLANNGIQNVLGAAATSFAQQVYITEHARYTGAAWDSELDSSDGPLAGSRLASQLISVHAIQGNANTLCVECTPSLPYSLPVRA